VEAMKAPDTVKAGPVYVPGPKKKKKSSPATSRVPEKKWFYGLEGRKGKRPVLTANAIVWGTDVTILMTPSRKRREGSAW